jgi:hypothetical protein
VVACRRSTSFRLCIYDIAQAVACRLLTSLLLLFTPWCKCLLVDFNFSSAFIRIDVQARGTYWISCIGLCWMVCSRSSVSLEGTVLKLESSRPRLKLRWCVSFGFSQAANFPMHRWHTRDLYGVSIVGANAGQIINNWINAHVPIVLVLGLCHVSLCLHRWLDGSFVFGPRGTFPPTEPLQAGTCAAAHRRAAVAGWDGHVIVSGRVTS